MTYELFKDFGTKQGCMARKKLGYPALLILLECLPINIYACDENVWNKDSVFSEPEKKCKEKD